MDYCNAVFGSTNDVHLRPLQSVLNAAARLIVRKRKYDPITASIRDDLHWLPVQQRHHYKLLLLVYKSLHDPAPPYLAEQCRPVPNTESLERLRTNMQNDLVRPRTKLVNYGDRSFGSSGPKLWNQLPADIRDPSLTLKQFTKKLKTVLFNRAYYA